MLPSAVAALNIWHPQIRRARVEVDDEALVLGPVDVLLERVLEGLLADEEGEAAVRGRVQELEEDALDVRRPAFVEPKVCCLSVAEGF